MNAVADGTFRVIALGDFGEAIPPLSPRLNALKVVPLRCAMLDQLPRPLTGRDILLTELAWLATRSPSEREALERVAKATAGWIALTEAHAGFKEQIVWQRLGVGHFFARPLDAERLAVLVEDIHDRVAGAPVRVILLDDEESALAYYGTTLERAGVVVQATQDPLLVLDIIEEFKPDLLLVDIEMPGCRGPELATVVRQRGDYAKLPVIYLTAMEGMGDLLAARRSAMEDFLSKPVPPELLVTAVCSQAWRYRAQRRNEALLWRRAGEERQRLEQLRNAVDAHAIVSVCDVKGTIIHVNDRFCAVSGYSRAELLGQNHRMVKSDVHPAEFYRNLWSTIASGKIWFGEVCNRRKNGELYWVEATIVPFLDARGRPYQYISIRTDITALKKSQLDAQESERRLHLSQSYANVGTWDWDLERNEIRISHFVSKLIGDPSYTPVVSPDYFFSRMFEGHRERVAKLIAAATTTGAPYDAEYLTIYQDGTQRWIQARGAIQRAPTGKATHMLGIVQDIHQRKLAELSLEDSEKRLREAQALAHVGSWQFDLVSQKIRWSDEVYKIFGKDPDTFEPDLESFFEAVHPDDRKRVQIARERGEETGLFDVTHRIVCPDGSVRHVHEIARLPNMESGQGKIAFGTVQDITDRIEADAHLKESQERFAFAVEGAGDGVWDLDMQTRRMRLSGSYEAMLGYENKEIEQQIDVSLSLIHLEDLPRVGEAYARYLAGEAPVFSVEIRKRCKDGSYKWVLTRGKIIERDQDGKPLRMTGIQSDISERKAAEERLALFGRVFDASSQCIGVANSSGAMIYHNNAFARQMGYVDSEILGRDAKEYFLPDRAEALWAELLAAARAAGHWAGLVPFRRKDGSTFPGLNNVGFLRDTNGSIQYIFNIFTDFSEELARRSELAEAKETAERANHAKSEFLSSMSHELRTPMNAIIGFAQMLEYDKTLNADQQDNVHEILKGGRHLLELINEVLDLAKIESGRIEFSIEPVVLACLADDCQSLIQPMAAARHIDLSVELHVGAVARADRMRLKQVLLNLLSNAVKYNREGGSIRLDIQPVANERVRIAVTDTGMGIAPEHLDDLFQPFNRLGAEQSEIEGTGIGLTISRRLVEMMGGTLGVDSQVGSGSTFWIELPGESGVLPEGVTGEPAATPPYRHLVLCIDDNPANLKLIAQMFGRRPQVRLITAHTPELGIELALAHRPQLILLDINMPGMDGYRVLDVFKADAQLKSLPVVAVTANAMPRDIERGMAAGFAAYLTKPLDVDAFLQTIDRFLSGDGSVAA